MDFFPHIFSMEEKFPTHQEACSDWRTRRWCHHTLAVQVCLLIFCGKYFLIFWIFLHFCSWLKMGIIKKNLPKKNSKLFSNSGLKPSVPGLTYFLLHSHFGFYDSSEKVVEMRNQDVSCNHPCRLDEKKIQMWFEFSCDFSLLLPPWKFYRKDTFGLKTLDARGDVSVCVHSGVKHVHWHSNFTLFQSCMEKWLT